MLLVITWTWEDHDLSIKHTKGLSFYFPHIRRSVYKKINILNQNELFLCYLINVSMCLYSSGVLSIWVYFYQILCNVIYFAYQKALIPTFNTIFKVQYNLWKFKNKHAQCQKKFCSQKPAFKISYIQICKKKTQI